MERPQIFLKVNLEYGPKPACSQASGGDQAAYECSVNPFGQPFSLEPALRHTKKLRRFTPFRHPGARVPQVLRRWRQTFSFHRRRSGTPDRRVYSTVTLLARFRGLSTSQPRAIAMW